MLVMLVASISNAQTATISGTTYHGVSGDNFITIANAWNEGTITSAWQWSFLDLYYEGRSYDDVASLPSPPTNATIIVRTNGQDTSVPYYTRESGRVHEFFVVPLQGVGNPTDEEGNRFYAIAEAAGNVFVEASLDDSQNARASQRAQELADDSGITHVVYSRSSISRNAYIEINNREYLLAERGVSGISYGQLRATANPVVANPYNGLVGWTLHDQSGIDASFPDRTLPIAIHPSGDFAVLHIPGGYNLYNYANGAFVGGNTHRFGSIEEVINHFGG